MFFFYINFNGHIGKSWYVIRKICIN